MTTVTRVGDFTLTWGESLRWDERRDRLYFVDCATQTLHWLEGGEPPLHSLQLSSMPAGVALTEGNELVACLDDGLYIIDPDTESEKMLVGYPEGILGRANDANADGSGNLVTGTLNMGPAPGASWWFSIDDGWRLLDNDIANTNGPVVIDVDGQSTLALSDTGAGVMYAYPYDGEAGKVGERRVFGNHTDLGGVPDGAAADAHDAVWSCVLGVGKIARFTPAGVDQVIDVPFPNPSDVTFGGPDLSRLFVVSIALNLGEAAQPTAESGRVLAIDGLGVGGRPEARFRLG